MREGWTIQAIREAVKSGRLKEPFSPKRSMPALGSTMLASSCRNIGPAMERRRNSSLRLVVGPRSTDWWPS